MFSAASQRASSSRRRFVSYAVAVGMALLFAGAAVACPTCREGLAESDPQGQALAAGFFYSILLMLSTPVVIVVSFGAMAYRAVKRARLEREAAVES